MKIFIFKRQTRGNTYSEHLRKKRINGSDNNKEYVNNNNGKKNKWQNGKKKYCKENSV